MDSEEILNTRKRCMLLVVGAGLCILKKMQSNQNKQQRRRRRWWVRPIYTRKFEQGDYYNLYREMREEDPDLFFNYTRMTRDMFDELLSLVHDYLRKKSNRPSIPAECRLLITLRLLASGDSLQSMALAFRMGKATVCNVFRETCEVLWKVLQPIYIPEIVEQQKWHEISEEFFLRWQLPNCVGAIDGKHINLKQPNNSGSMYFNYKKSFSINLFGICDANYKFIAVDIGAFGSESDGGVLRESQFGQALNENRLDLPPNKLLPGSAEPFPHFFIGDDAFPLQTNLLKPYAGKFLPENLRIFNYSLSRGRRCIENTFGILAARWRIFHKTINAFPETVDKIVQATTCLHNFIITKQEELQHHAYCNDQFVDREIGNVVIGGHWREEIPDGHALRPIQRRLGARNARRCALQSRDYYRDYVNNEGSVPWQQDYVNAIK